MSENMADPDGLCPTCFKPTVSGNAKLIALLCKDCGYFACPTCVINLSCCPECHRPSDVSTNTMNLWWISAADAEGTPPL